ncbi:MAG: hypothetical protein KJ077_14245 [Anaerolineae bacterium]|nr:hypothetical protein [Anaerolineae bacterium]
MPVIPQTFISARPHRKSTFEKLQSCQRRPARLYRLDLLMAPPPLRVEEIDAEPNETHFEPKMSLLSNNEEALC